MLNELELKETALVSATFVAREEKRGKGGEGEWREMWVRRMDGKRGKRGRKGRGKMEGWGGGGGGGGFLAIRREIKLVRPLLSRSGHNCGTSTF